MNNTNPDRIIAVVSPRSLGGKSLFDMVEPIHARNVQQFYSADIDIAAASTELRKAGFDILDCTSPITISIAGSRKLFEDVFGATFAAKNASFTRTLRATPSFPTRR